MKRFIGILSCMLIAVGVFAAEPQTTEEVDKAIVEQLKLLNKKMTGIEKKLDKVLNKNGVMAAGVAANGGVVGQTISISQPAGFRGPSKADLSHIKFPKNPTKENLKKYVEEIRIASKRQKSFSDNDKQIEMYTKVGHKNLDILLESFGKAKKWNDGQFHLQRAIGKLITKDDKELIIRNLSKNRSLINYVVRYGWEKDVKQTLIDRLRDTPDLPQTWIVAVAALKEPKTYPDLQEYFIVSRNRAQIYQYIKDLPGLKLDNAVDEAWNIVSGGKNNWEKKQMAVIAAGYGHVDALFFLLDAKVPQNSHMSSPDFNAILAKKVDKSGSITEIKEWLIKNRKNIVFDKKAGKYMLTEKAKK